GLGVSLYHAAFGFTDAYRRAILQRDISGITAQMVMLAAAMLLFAPVLAAGQVFGHGVIGAVAPASLSMAFGALIFGVGMQMGGGCASGTLFTVGGGNLRMLLVLVFFCAGAFWASLDLQWW
ncbi:MAG: YeeE/YedE family protein, partial [Lysobacterales bacterium]